MPIVNLADIPPRTLLPGYRVRFVHSESMTLAYWEIEEGAALPQHAHEHEQVTNLIRGSFRLTIDGMESTLSPGQVAVIPSGVTHAGVALTACEIIDVFHPVREDYRETS